MDAVRISREWVEPLVPQIVEPIEKGDRIVEVR